MRESTPMLTLESTLKRVAVRIDPVVSFYYLFCGISTICGRFVVSIISDVSFNGVG